MDDAELLKRFVAERSESAFEGLVRRHVNLVYSAALRQVGNAALAEEVSQAVFVLLARKAGTVEATRLPGWLFKTSHFVASRALRAEMRRRKREQEAFTMQEIDRGEENWQRLAPELDDAMMRLGTSEREALILRYFSGQTTAEAARSLGISEEAAKKRMSRGVEKLREFFGRHGFKVSAGALLLLLEDRAITAAPASVMAACAGAAAAKVSVMATGAMAAMRLWKFWKAAAAISVAIAAALGLVHFKRGDTNPAPPPRSETVAINPKAEQASGAERARRPVAGELLLHAVDADSGAPITNAMVAVASNFQFTYGLTTDDHGDFAVKHPGGDPFGERGYGRLDVGVFAQGWEAKFVTWGTMEGDLTPTEYTLRLARVTNVIGGRIVDESGDGIAGAQIFFNFGGLSDTTTRESDRERIGFIGEIALATTDEEGRWKCAMIPNQNRGFTVSVKRPPFEPGTIYSGGPAVVMSEESAPKLRQLLAQTHVETLRRGVNLTGYAQDEEGRPIAGAKIYKASQEEVFTADPGGAFYIAGLNHGPASFTVTAKGFAPARISVELAAPNEETTVKLKPGATLRVKLLDENGAAVAGATVGIEQWGESRHVLDWEAQSDDAGLVVWDSAPVNERLELFARKSDFCYTREIWLKADGEEHVIPMQRALAVSGRVVDAKTQQPIAEFKVFPAYGEGPYRWNRLETVRGTNGLFTLRMKERTMPWSVRIEANGYQEWDSPTIDPRSGGRVQAALRPIGAEEIISGVVLNPAGKPASGATVALLNFDADLELENFRLSRPPERWTRVTDASGAFKIASSPVAHSVVAVSREGFARARLTNGSPLTVLMQAWGRIEGSIDPKIKPATYRAVNLQFAIVNYPGKITLVGPSTDLAVDGNGRFTMNYAPPELLQASLAPRGNGESFHHLTFVQVEPGQTTRLVVQHRGALLKGRLVAPNAGVTNWAKQLRFGGINRAAKGRAAANTNAEKMREVEFWFSEAGREQALAGWGANLKLGADGAFEASEPLAAGTYKLFASVESEYFESEFEVPEVDGVGEVDLGEILPKPRKQARGR